MSVLNIVIPVYNGSKFIKKSLDSIFAQSFSDFQIFVVNDGSTDDTKSILDNFKTHSNFHIINQSNKGAGYSRNIGLNKSYRHPSKYTIILDSDDIYKKDFFGKMINIANFHDSDITICRSMTLNNLNNKTTYLLKSVNSKKLPKGSSPISTKSIESNIFNFCVGWSWDKLYKTDFLKKNNLTFQDLQNTDDLSFVYTSLYKSSKISYLDEYLIYHTINNNLSISSNISKNYKCCWDALLKLKSNLINDKLYNKFEQSYMYLSFNFSIWFLANCITSPNLNNLFKEYSDFDNKYFKFEKYNYLKDTKDWKLYSLIRKNDINSFIKLINKKNKRKNQARRICERFRFINLLVSKLIKL